MTIHLKNGQCSLFFSVVVAGMVVFCPHANHNSVWHIVDANPYDTSCTNADSHQEQSDHEHCEFDATHKHHFRVCPKALSVRVVLAMTAIPPITYVQDVLPSFTKSYCKSLLKAGLQDNSTSSIHLLI